MSKFSVGAPHKKLPKWCFELDKEQTQTLIHSMMLGDGCLKKATSASMYYTTSSYLADQFMQLCLHAGWSSNKTEHCPRGQCTKMKNGRVITGNHIVWRLSVVKHKNNAQVNHAHCKAQKMQQEYTYDYEGPVYCLQVPSEVFYVRRNGKPCWTGNSRSNNGPLILLTRQSCDGRSRDGGLRVGEMELDTLIAHGTMQFQKERFMECADNYRVFICKKCGLMANVNPEKNIFNCRNCKNLTDFAEIRIPYAMKLLSQEMQTMNIACRFQCS